ncbi:rod-binding protein [Gallaecimonas kandeliae]|uniref:rod-binding protein n=1 Tax=Gallaecimonas kandeliae TaxID=3029055 RepID=UPI002647ADF4|nr:rod-binding protein [Gallaecimonas kandeliae]WKE66536.1 rod-binding protein [Gallaecimonas kandeliae]
MDAIQAAQGGFYQDSSRLRSLKGPEGLKAAAGEFEAMFLQMVLKNMRQASQALADEDNLFNSRQQQFYQAMADGQLSKDVSSRANLGLADAISRQWGGLAAEELKEKPEAVASHPVGTAALRQPLNRTGKA